MKQKFLNKNYFLFSFALISKKISIYISISIYLLLILAYTLIVPLVSEDPPIRLFLFPIAPSFLLFAMVVVSCFIAIEIFRTPIDDGTELLVVSKPLDRRQICLVKFAIFTLYMLAISISAAIVATTSYIVPDSLPQDNRNIILGMLFASFIIGSLFGSIAILFSLFSKKIISMLITIGIAFILNVTSMMGTLVFDTPSTVIQNSENVIAPVNLLNIDNKNNQIINGVVKGNQNSTKKASEIYNDAYNSTPYTKTVYTDFSLQLSSLYTFGQSSADTTLAISAQFAMNSPYRLTFNNYAIPTVSEDGTTVNNPSNTSYLRIKIPQEWFNQSNPGAGNDSDIIKSFSDQMFLYSINKKSRVTPEDFKETNVSGVRAYSTEDFNRSEVMDDTEFNKLWTDWFDKAINQFWSDYSNNSNQYPEFPTITIPPTGTNPQFTNKDLLKVAKFLAAVLNDLAGNIIEEYFTEHLNYNFNHRTDEKYMRDKIQFFNTFIYSGINKYLLVDNNEIDFGKIIKDINWSGITRPTKPEDLKNFWESLDKNNPQFKNTLYKLIFLRFLSVDFETLISSFEKLNFSSNIFKSNIPFEATINNSEKKIKFYFISAYKVQSQIPFVSFEEAHISSVYNIAALITTWLIISWLFLGVTMSLYYRRDFA